MNSQSFGFRYIVACIQYSTCTVTYSFSFWKRSECVSFFARTKSVSLILTELKFHRCDMLWTPASMCNVHSQVMLNIWFRLIVLHEIFSTCLEYRFACWSCSSTVYFGYRLKFRHFIHRNNIQTKITEYISFEYLFDFNTLVGLFDAKDTFIKTTTAIHKEPNSFEFCFLLLNNMPSICCWWTESKLV